MIHIARLIRSSLVMLGGVLCLLAGSPTTGAADAPSPSSLNREERAYDHLSRVGPTDAVRHAAKQFLEVEVRVRRLGNSLATGIGGRTMAARKKRFERFEDFFEQKQLLEDKAGAFIQAVQSLPPHDHPTLTACVEKQALCEPGRSVDPIACATRLALCLAPHFTDTAKAN